VHNPGLWNCTFHWMRDGQAGRRTEGYFVFSKPLHTIGLGCSSKVGCLTSMHRPGFDPQGHKKCVQYTHNECIYYWLKVSCVNKQNELLNSMGRDHLHGKDSGQS
jgi:hypothetical protein